MTSTIPTDPDAYDHAAVQAELQAIRTLQPKLALYDGREFRELPKQLQDGIRALKTITQPTSSGLERVSSLLWQLATLEPMLAALHQGESIADQIASLSQAVPDQLLSVTPGIDETQLAVEVEQGATPGSAPPPPPSTKKTGGTLTLTTPLSDTPLGSLLRPGSGQANPPEGRSSSGGTLSLPVDGD